MKEMGEIENGRKKERERERERVGSEVGVLALRAAVKRGQ